MIILIKKGGITPLLLLFLLLFLLLSLKKGFFAGLFQLWDLSWRILRKISVPNAPFSRPPAPPPAPTVVRKILNPTFGKSRGALFNFSIFRGFSGSGTFPGGFFGKFQYRTPRFRGVSSHPLPQRWYANFQPSFFAKSTTQGGGSPPPRTPPFRRPPAGDKSLRFCRGGAAPPNPTVPPASGRRYIIKVLGLPPRGLNPQGG